MLSFLYYLAVGSPVHFPYEDNSQAGFSAAYGKVYAVAGGGVRLQGDSRAYLVKNHESDHPWRHEYQMLDLRGKSLSFDVDVSKVSCSVNAAFYLVAMKGQGYCDIQSNPWCVELDLFEANSHAIQVTVHTQRGIGGDGTCNQWGCTTNWGELPRTYNNRSTAELYGPGAEIDTDWPFRVTASMAGRLRARKCGPPACIRPAMSWYSRDTPVRMVAPRASAVS